MSEIEKKLDTAVELNEEELDSVSGGLFMNTGVHPVAGKIPNSSGNPTSKKTLYTTDISKKAIKTNTNGKDMGGTVSC